MTEFVDVPTVGRTYARSRCVALGDVNPNGLLRLDALARFVQDIATADAADALDGSAFAYVLRRLAMRIDQAAMLSERLTLTTFCGGIARGWAERRTSIVGDDGARIETAAIWVPIDERGRPIRLPLDFLAAYGEAARGRRVEARLTHNQPNVGDVSRVWPLRFVDLDTLAHVNNAAHWCAMEDDLRGQRVREAEIEFVSPLLFDQQCTFVSHQVESDQVDGWLCAEGHVRSSQRVWMMS
jgi:acyl-ACP thioesterase